MLKIRFVGLFLYRFILNCIFNIVIELPLMLIGAIILLPWLGLTKKAYQLPMCLKWYDNVDGYIGRNTDTYHAVVDSGWWNQYCWLTFRNPLNYFSYVVTGRKNENGSFLTVGNVNIGDTSQPGFYYIEFISISGKKSYQYYYIGKYSNNYCFRFRMGWKIDVTDPINTYWESCFVISPFHSYTGV